MVTWLVFGGWACGLVGTEKDSQDLVDSGVLGEIFGGNFAMRINNNNTDKVHVQMALYIPMPQGFPLTRLLIFILCSQQLDFTVLSAKFLGERGIFFATPNQTFFVKCCIKNLNRP